MNYLHNYLLLLPFSSGYCAKRFINHIINILDPGLLQSFSENQIFRKLERSKFPNSIYNK